MPEIEGVFLDQTPPNQVEGPTKDNPAIVFEVQRLALDPLTILQVRTRQRGRFWTVGILSEGAVVGDEVKVWINQGEASLPDRALGLGEGGSVTFPAASSTLTLTNVTGTGLWAIVIASSEPFPYRLGQVVIG